MESRWQIPEEKLSEQMNDKETLHQSAQENRILVVTNREPVVFTGTGIKYPAGGVSQSLHRLLGKKGGVWIATRDSDGPDNLHIISPEGPGYDLERIPLPIDLKSAFYEGYSNDVLWPAFHGCPEFMAPSPSFFSSYDQVNHIFAKKIARVLKKETPSVVWIHDYQLTRVATWLRKDNIRNLPPLAFFCHIPWPSKEHLTHVVEYKEILEGLLSHDLIGFQTDQDRQNFLLAIKSFMEDAVIKGDGTVQWNGRQIRVVSMPIGVDPVLFGRMSQNPRNLAKAHAILSANNLGNFSKFLISVDRMDYTKGFIQRLEIIRKLFRRNPHLRGQLSLLQIAVPTRTGQKTYRNHQEKIRQGVLALNREFGTKDWMPIISIEETIDQETLAGLYRLADGALITSTIDGMNLVSQEFLASQNGGSGILFLSQYTGTATILKDAHQIDPLNPDESVEKILSELSRPLAERRLKNLSLLHQIQENDLNHWLASLLSNVSLFSRNAPTQMA